MPDEDSDRLMDCLNPHYGFKLNEVVNKLGMTAMDWINAAIDRDYAEHIGTDADIEDIDASFVMHNPHDDEGPTTREGATDPIWIIYTKHRTVLGWSRSEALAQAECKELQNEKDMELHVEEDRGDSLPPAVLEITEKAE